MTGNVQEVMKNQLNMSFDDLPYLGKPFMRKEDDPANRQPQPRLVAHVKVFDLSKEEDILEYEAVMQRAATNTCTIYEMDRQYAAEKQNFIVYMHWADMYMVNPDIANDIKLVRAEAGARQLPNQCEDIAPKTVGRPSDKKQ